jgi:hypothetical protein
MLVVLISSTLVLLQSRQLHRGEMSFEGAKYPKAESQVDDDDGIC